MMPETGPQHEGLMLFQLHTPPGLPGSGRVRYAAAMYFNRTGRLSDAALEVYRICSPTDSEDPATLLAERRLGHEISVPTATAEGRLRLLLSEIGPYLGTLSGPGVAEARKRLALHDGAACTGCAPRQNAVTSSHMPRALAALRVTHPALAQAISGAQNQLHWITYDGYPTADVGRSFSENHAYAPLIGGADAPFAAEDWEIGLFLIAPHVLYRDHRHLAPELYLPLTGPHGWRFGPDRALTIKPAHQPVWNAPMVPHLTKVGPVPFLCVYIWAQDVNAVAEIVPAADWDRLEALRLGGVT